MYFRSKKKCAPTTNPNFKILVVEDDPSLCEVIGSLFEMNGYGFNIVNDVENITPLLSEFNPDLVLIDYVLPSTNGGELCMQIKTDHHNAHIPVIIYSAMNKDLLPIKEYHFDAFIEKPFDIDVLIHKMDALLTKQTRLA